MPKMAYAYGLRDDVFTLIPRYAKSTPTLDVEHLIPYTLRLKLGAAKGNHRSTK